MTFDEFLLNPCKSNAGCTTFSDQFNDGLTTAINRYLLLSIKKVLCSSGANTKLKID